MVYNWLRTNVMPMPHEKAFILMIVTEIIEENKLTLESSKTLGGIGAILLFIGVIPFIQYSWVIGIIGAILILVALRGLANYYKEGGIFSNALYGVAMHHSRRNHYKYTCICSCPVKLNGSFNATLSRLEW